MSEKKSPVKRRGRPMQSQRVSSRPGPWLRLYRETIHDPKIVLLTDAQFRAWAITLCVADHVTGKIPSLRQMSVHLRKTPQEAEHLIEALIDAGLIDCDYGTPSEPRFMVHNWAGRQRVWDSADHTNADRQKRHRDRRNGVVTENSNGRNGGVTVNVTENGSESVSVVCVSESDSVSQGVKPLGTTVKEDTDSRWRDESDVEDGDDYPLTDHDDVEDR